MRDPAQRRNIWTLLVAVLVVVAGWWLIQQGDTLERAFTDRTEQSVQDDARTVGDTDAESGLPLVAVEDLPAEARETIRRIEQGGPFPYECCDDTTFRNDEGLLPDEPRGYYREYTVETPGSSDRGARRIVVGDLGEHYWTADHYQSFERIDLDQSGGDGP